MGLSAHVPDLAALEVLLGVARTGSLNSAAQQVGVSQQAVSARIRAMEAQTGVTLVRRTPRGSSLTAEGAVIDLRRSLRVIWAGAANPPAGAARDLIAHILSRRVPGPGTARGEAERARPR
jgi:molybdate transport repressor ModE-like protein